MHCRLWHFQIEILLDWWFTVGQNKILLLIFLVILSRAAWQTAISLGISSVWQHGSVYGILRSTVGWLTHCGYSSHSVVLPSVVGCLFWPVGSSGHIVMTSVHSDLRWTVPWDLATSLTSSLSKAGCSCISYATCNHKNVTKNLIFTSKTYKIRVDRKMIW